MNNNLSKLGFFAVGIPDKNKISPMRDFKDPEVWDAVIHQHNSVVAPYHKDFRLLDPITNIVYSFVVQDLPGPGEKRLAIRQPDHSSDSLSFTGKIPRGQYGAGTMERVFGGKVEILKSTPDKITFVVYKGSTAERYSLIKPGSFENNNYLLINHTPTEKRGIPQKKSHYPEIKPDKIDVYDNNQILSEKLDGSHALFVLRKNKPIETFSYRPSKKSTNPIDHTFKTDLYKSLAKTEKETILRGELLGIKKDKTGPLSNSEIAGLLNSGTLKSREDQERKGKLEPFIFDIDKYEGKDVRSLPYALKLPLLKEIAQIHPKFKLPSFANNFSDKQILISDIKSGRNPLTSEGIIVYNLDRPVPTKVPFKRTADLRILGFFSPSSGSKYDGKAVGGYIAQEKDGGPKIRVGTGLDDETRMDMYNNPDKYLNQLTTVEYKERLKSGLLRTPSHKYMRNLW